METKQCQLCGSNFERLYFYSRKYFASQKYCSQKCTGISKRGIIPSSAFKKGSVPWNKNKTGIYSNAWKLQMVATRRANGTYRKFTDEERFLKREYQPKGSAHYNWKGGKTAQAAQVRNSLEYKMWRESVFQRDGFICQFCGEKGGDLNAHHIRPFAIFPNLRFDVLNGITLCVRCHNETPTRLDIEKEKITMCGENY